MLPYNVAMATQRRVWDPHVLPRASGDLCLSLLVLRFVCGVVVPGMLLLAFGLAVWDGDVFIEGGRRFGPVNAYHLRGLACALYGVFGLLLSAGISLRAWAIGCEKDADCDHLHYGVLAGSGVALIGALLADSFVRGG